uniref:Glycosyl transferase family 1 domain-containing protein n=1 Tax=Fagus sylvatica TaxID=28930 RepID=A0A2N9FPT6_FAGSY
MIYSTFDVGNFFVIPGSPTEAWEADTVMALHKDNLHIKMGYEPEDVVIAIVGSQFLYRGLWVEHAIILQALLPVLSDFPLDNNSNSHLKIVVLIGDSTSNYGVVIEGIAINLKYPTGVVKHKALDVDADNVLSMADLVIYGSFLEEQSFPDILMKAMSFEKPIIAPDLSMIRKYVDDRVNGYLFPKENPRFLTQIIRQVFSKGKLSPLARNIASIGRSTAKNLMVSETVEGYALLLVNVLKLPSEVAPPKAVAEMPLKFKEKWQWRLFEAVSNSTYMNSTMRSNTYLDKFEQQWNNTRKYRLGAISAADGFFVYSIWEEEKNIAMANVRKRKEEEELKDRTDQSHGTWEEVYRSAKKTDRSKNDLHERDDGELERTGQPLSIYEPYFGEAVSYKEDKDGSLVCIALNIEFDLELYYIQSHMDTWTGYLQSTKGRRPGADDLDASARLPLLNNPYYRDILGEYGAFFAIANRIDRVHKNAWIGFQSWRATARKASLSSIAENALLDAIEARRHGDTLYFWARLDVDPRNPLQLDFWSFCDAINAGNCKFAFAEALKRMYGIKRDLDSLPPMPVDGGTWSVMQSWALPTRSFLEFVMFSRMFVDALDAHMYDEHHSSGHCYLSLSKGYHFNRGSLKAPPGHGNGQMRFIMYGVKLSLVNNLINRPSSVTEWMFVRIFMGQLGMDKHCYSRLLELLINVWAYHSARRMVYVNPETGEMQEHHRLKSRRGQMWIRWFSYTTLKSMDEDLAEEADSEHPNRRWLWPSTGEVFWQGVYERERTLRHRQKEDRRQKSKEKIDRIRRRTHQKVIGKYVKPPPGMKNSNTSLDTPRTA